MGLYGALGAHKGGGFRPPTPGPRPLLPEAFEAPFRSPPAAQLATFRHAFDATSLPALVMNIVSGNFQPVHDLYSKEMRDLISACLCKDPALRPAVDDLLTWPVVRSAVQKCNTEWAVDIKIQRSYVRPFFEAGSVETALSALNHAERVGAVASGPSSGDGSFRAGGGGNKAVTILPELEDEHQFLTYVTRLRGAVAVGDRLLGRIPYFKVRARTRGRVFPMKWHRVRPITCQLTVPSIGWAPVAPFAGRVCGLCTRVFLSTPHSRAAPPPPVLCGLRPRRLPRHVAGPGDARGGGHRGAAMDGRWRLLSRHSLGALLRRRGTLPLQGWCGGALWGGLVCHRCS